MYSDRRRVSAISVVAMFIFNSAFVFVSYAAAGRRWRDDV